MPMKYQSRCATCKLMKKDPVFKRRFYTTTYFDAQARESLSSVVEAYHIYASRRSMYLHAKNHGTWSPRGKPRSGESIKAFNERTRKTQQALSTLKEVSPELVVDGKVDPNNQPEEDWTDSLDEVIKQGMEDLRSGKMKINASQFVTALKIKADREASKGGQQADMLAAMAAMMTGGGKRSAE